MYVTNLFYVCIGLFGHICSLKNQIFLLDIKDLGKISYAHQPSNRVRMRFGKKGSPIPPAPAPSVSNGNVNVNLSRNSLPAWAIKLKASGGRGSDSDTDDINQFAQENSLDPNAFEIVEIDEPVNEIVQGGFGIMEDDSIYETAMKYSAECALAGYRDKLEAQKEALQEKSEELNKEVSEESVNKVAKIDEPIPTKSSAEKSAEKPKTPISKAVVDTEPVSSAAAASPAVVEDSKVVEKIEKKATGLQRVENLSSSDEEDSISSSPEKLKQPETSSRGRTIRRRVIANSDRSERYNSSLVIFEDFLVVLFYMIRFLHAVQIPNLDPNQLKNLENP